MHGASLQRQWRGAYSRLCIVGRGCAVSALLLVSGARAGVSEHATPCIPGRRALPRRCCRRRRLLRPRLGQRQPGGRHGVCLGRGPVGRAGPGHGGCFAAHPRLCTPRPSALYTHVRAAHAGAACSWRSLGLGPEPGCATRPGLPGQHCVDADETACIGKHHHPRTRYRRRPQLGCQRCWRSVCMYVCQPPAGSMPDARCRGKQCTRAVWDGRGRGVSAGPLAGGKAAPAQRGGGGERSCRGCPVRRDCILCSSPWLGC